MHYPLLDFRKEAKERVEVAMAQAEIEFAKAETAGFSLDRATKNFVSAVFFVFIREMSEYCWNFPHSARNARELAMTFLWELTSKAAEEKMGFNTLDARFLGFSNEVKREIGSSPKFVQFMADMHEVEFIKTSGTCESQIWRVDNISNMDQALTHEDGPGLSGDDVSPAGDPIAAERTTPVNAYAEERREHGIKIADRTIILSAPSDRASSDSTVELAKNQGEISESFNHLNDFDEFVKDRIEAVKRERFPNLSKEGMAAAVGIDRRAFFDFQAGRYTSNNVLVTASEVFGIPFEMLVVRRQPSKRKSRPPKAKPPAD